MCHNLSFSTSRRYHTIVFIYPFFYSHVIDTHCPAKELDWRITTIGFANSSHFKIIATKLCSVRYCGADYIWRLPISTFGPLWYQVINMFETSFTEPIWQWTWLVLFKNRKNPAPTKLLLPLWRSVTMRAKRQLSKESWKFSLSSSMNKVKYMAVWNWWKNNQWLSLSYNLYQRRAGKFTGRRTVERWSHWSVQWWNNLKVISLLQSTSQIACRWKTSFNGKDKDTGRGE